MNDANSTCGFHSGWDDVVAVALAGQYANYLHLSRQITAKVPYHSIFTDRMHFVIPNQVYHAGTTPI